MHCDRVRALLSAYADGELPRTLSARVGGHLDGCEACAAELRSLSELVAALHALPADDPPTELHRSILLALDAAQPSLWQRLCGTTVWVPGNAPVVFAGAGAAAFALVLTVSPVHRGLLGERNVTHIVYGGPTRSILAPMKAPPAVPAAPAVVSHPTQPQRAATVASPEGLPERAILADAQGALVRPAAAKKRVSAPRAAQRGARKPVVRAIEKRRGQPSAGPAMPPFDPLAPGLEPVGAPIEPMMPNVVVVDAPPVMPSSDTMRVASMSGDSTMETAGTTDDDLSSLRRRLEREQIQLPPVQFESRRVKAKRKPLLRGDF